MQERDRAYYARRMIEERQAGERSAHPKAARAHRDLADRYEKLANGDDAVHLRIVASRKKAA